MKLKRKELEKIKEQKIDERREYLKVLETDEIKKLNEERARIAKERTGLKYTRKSLEKTVEKFDEKLREFRTPLYKWTILPDRTGLNTDLEKDSLDEKRRELTLKIDLDVVAKNLEPFHEMENAVKTAREKLKLLEKKKDQLHSKLFAMEPPKKAENLLEDYKDKLNVQKYAHALNNAKNKLIEVETELHSNDYKMQAPDLLGDIKNIAGSYWARRDMRKGLHINTKEFSTMINAVKDLKDLDFKGKTSINELNADERKKLGNALIEARNKAKEYLKAKMQQTRNKPSALRRTRLGYALALVDGLDAKIKSLDEVNKKYLEVEKAVAGKAKQLEVWKQNPVLVDPAKLKTNVNEVKAAETTKKDPEIAVPSTM